MGQLAMGQAMGREVVENWVERVNWSHSLDGHGEDAIDGSS